MKNVPFHVDIETLQLPHSILNITNEHLCTALKESQDGILTWMEGADNPALWQFLDFNSFSFSIGKK